MLHLFLASQACSYFVAALSQPNSECMDLQVLILTTSREIALQAAETVDNLAHACGQVALTAGVFIGGLPMGEDVKLLRR